MKKSKSRIKYLLFYNMFIFMFFFHKAKTIISTICAEWDCKIYMSKISLRKNKKIPRNSIVQIVADA